MKLSEISVNRPVFATMMILALLVLGAFSYMELPVEMFPDVDFPFVVVQTVYPGASAEAVETEVTEYVEEAVNQISGVRHIISESREGISLVFVEFDLEIDGAVAAQDVREKVSQIRATLPEDIEEPIVSQHDPDAQAIISLAVSGRRSPKEITELVKDKIKPRLEIISGIGSVRMIGASEREIRVALDPIKMESYEITIDDVRYAVTAANLEIPGGRVEESSREYLVRMLGKITRVSQFDSVVVTNKSGTPIYLTDIATVLDTVVEQRSLSRLNGDPAVGLELVKQSGSNVVAMAQKSREVIVQLQEELPPDISIKIVNDESGWIEDSIHEVNNNIMVGTTLAVIVIFLFLLSWRPTFITGVSIPISIVATFTFMNFLGFTINFMTLLGISLSVGILIDDAIVVVENIYRHLDEGKSPIQAAVAGTKEIGLAVMATTFSIMVVFLPVAFMEGIVGRFFYSFGMTVAFAVLISLFVAFSLTPMLSSRMLKPGESMEGGGKRRKGFIGAIFSFLNLWNRAFDSMKPVYKDLLAWSLRHRFLTMTAATALFVAVLVVIAPQLPMEFIPQADAGKTMISIKTPPGTDLETTSARFAEVEEAISGIEEINSRYVSIGGANSPVTEGFIFLNMTPADDRELSALQISDSMRVLLADIPGILYSVGLANSDGGGSGKPVEVSIRGDDLDRVRELVRRVEQIVRETPGATDIDNTLEEGKPEIQVTVDRNAADDLGLSLATVPTTVRTLVEGEVVTRFREGDEEYDVRIQLDDKYRASSEDIGRILVASTKEIDGKDNFLVPLDRVATLEKSTAIGNFLRADRQREARVNANVLTGFAGGTVAGQVLERAAAEIELPPGYEIVPFGTQEIMIESFRNIMIALFLSVVFIYLLLASQYESFFDPLSIMLSLPLALVGAILGLWAFDSTISIMSLIGIVMLMGLVTKNAILLIDFVKQQRDKGVSRTDAVLIAGPVRLRPILMTTFATVFGMLPLALEIGAGSEFRAGMAQAVIGGMISSTLLTLVVVPVVYTIIDDVFAFFFGRREKTEAVLPQLEKVTE